MKSFVYLILSKILFAGDFKNKSNLATSSISVPYYENYTILENFDLKKRTIGNIRSGYRRSFISSLSGCKKLKECKPKIQNKCKKVLPSIEDHFNSLKILNFVRELAGLPKNIIEDEQWSEQCYKSAINIQKMGKIPFDHLIKKEDATEQNCGDESNIQFTNNSRLLITENSMSVYNSLFKFIISEKITNQISLLDPNLGKIGFGFYPFRKEKINGFDSIKPSITVIKISDKPLSINSVDDTTNLNFISWPPEGPFPIEFLHSNWFIKHEDFKKTKTSEIKISIKIEEEEKDYESSELKVESISIVNDDVLVFKVSKELLEKYSEMKTIVVTVINHHTKNIYRFSFKLFKADQKTYFRLNSIENNSNKGRLNSENLNRKSIENNHNFLNVLAIFISSVSILTIIVFMGVGNRLEASENEDVEGKEEKEENNQNNQNTNVKKDNDDPPNDGTASCCYCGAGCAYIGCACCAHNWADCDCDCDCDCDDCGFCDLCNIFL